MKRMTPAWIGVVAVLGMALAGGNEANTNGRQVPMRPVVDFPSTTAKLWGSDGERSVQIPVQYQRTGQSLGITLPTSEEMGRFLRPAPTAKFWNCPNISTDTPGVRLAMVSSVIVLDKNGTLGELLLTDDPDTVLTLTRGVKVPGLRRFVHVYASETARLTGGCQTNTQPGGATVQVDVVVQPGWNTLVQRANFTKGYADYIITNSPLPNTANWYYIPD
jgi:hypothetical protein